MKILKVFSKEVKGTKYYKYIISLPKEVVENSHLLDKDLTAKLENGQIIIERI